MNGWKRIGQERPEHEEAPHAVDDRGDAGEQFDRKPDRAAQPERTNLGQEHRDAEADRNRDHHRDHGGDQRAVDRAERAEHRRIGRRRPARGEQEGKAVFPDRRPGADDQRNDDAAENEQHRDRAGAGQPVEGNVAELESAEGPGAIVRSGSFSFHHVALNRHVCHASPLYFYPTVPKRWPSCTRSFPDCAIAHLYAPSRRRPKSNSAAPGWDCGARALSRAGMRPGTCTILAQLLISEDQVFSISLTTGSGIGM